jgi:copper transport protein
MICVAALIVSGVVQALVEVGGWPGLVHTGYGQLLLAKVAILAAVLAVADRSRRWVTNHYGDHDKGSVAPTAAERTRSGAEVGRLRRAVAIETVLGVAAVAVAAVLIQAEPGRDALAAPPPSANPAVAAPITRHGPYQATVRQGDVVIHLKVDPAVVGVQYIYVDANRPDGRLLPVRQWTVTVSNDRLGLHQVNVPVLLDSGVGHHFNYGSFTMSVGGPWTIQVTARTSDVDETVVTRPVRVRS